MKSPSHRPSLILSSLDNIRKVNEVLRRENAELADTCDALIADMECLRAALEVLKNIVEMGGNTCDRPDR